MRKALLLAPMASVHKYIHIKKNDLWHSRETIPSVLFAKYIFINHHISIFSLLFLLFPYFLSSRSLAFHLLEKRPKIRNFQFY